MKFKIKYPHKIYNDITFEFVEELEEKKAMAQFNYQVKKITISNFLLNDKERLGRIFAHEMMHLHTLFSVQFININNETDQNELMSQTVEVWEEIREHMVNIFNLFLKKIKEKSVKKK